MSESPVVISTVEAKPPYLVWKYKLSGPIQPSDIAAIVNKFMEDIKSYIKKPDITILTISGRGPVWLYGALLHEAMHLFRFLAVYDPKVKGAVVVARHYSTLNIGQVLRPEGVDFE